VTQEPTRWRKKPVEVDVMYFDGTPENAEAIVRWAKGAITFAPSGPAHPENLLVIDTKEGVMAVPPHNFVICGVAGEFYFCDRDIFAQTYEHPDLYIRGAK
jgi:hypothetical protein